MAGQQNAKPAGTEGFSLAICIQHPTGRYCSKADEEAYTTLEHEVTEKGQDFADDDTFLYEQRIVTVNTRK